MYVSMIIACTVIARFYAINKFCAMTKFAVMVESIYVLYWPG